MHPCALIHRQVLHGRSLQRRSLQRNGFPGASGNRACDGSPLEALAARNHRRLQRRIHIARLNACDNAGGYAAEHAARNRAQRSGFCRHSEDHAARGRSACNSRDRHAHQNHAGADGDIPDDLLIRIDIVRPRLNRRFPVIAQCEDVFFSLKLGFQLIERKAKEDVGLRIVRQLLQILLGDIHRADVLDKVVLAVQRADQLRVQRILNIRQQRRIVQPPEIRLILRRGKARQKKRSQQRKHQDKGNQSLHSIHPFLTSACPEKSPWRCTPAAAHPSRQKSS